MLKLLFLAALSCYVLCFACVCGVLLLGVLRSESRRRATFFQWEYVKLPLITFALLCAFLAIFCWLANTTASAYTLYSHTP